jgi:hypothetical protein
MYVAGRIADVCKNRQDVPGMALVRIRPPRYALFPAGPLVQAHKVDCKRTRRMLVQARRLVPRFLPVIGLGTLLAGCAQPPPPVVEAPAPLPPHLGPPPAASCVVAPFHVADGGTADVNMTVSNDGGYCAATLTAANGKPFDAPLVPEKPAHGEDSVVEYNGKTSVEYTANQGYVGHDAFTVKLILKGQPGYTTLNVAVDVQPVAPAGAKSS